MTIVICVALSLLAVGLTVVNLYMLIGIESDVRHMKLGFEVNDAGHKELDESMDKCFDMVSKLSAETAELKRKMEAVDEVMEDFAEAGKQSKANEQAISEGINNILNYAPAIFKKGDEK